MIPVLFDTGETEFKTNGLGRLSDAIDCKVTEERNGIYELEMTYPIDGIHYSDIENGRLIFAESSQDADPEPFEVYLITRPLNGQVKVKAEHISYRMKYIPVKAFTASDIKSALQGLKRNAVCACPFEFDTDKTTSGDFKVETADSMRSFLADGDNTIAEVYGGEWEFKRFKAILHLARGSDNGVTIRYGKNLTSLEQEENIEEMVTGIYPYFLVNDNDDKKTTKIDPSTSRVTEITDSSGESKKKLIELPELIYKTKVKMPYDRITAVDLSDKLQDTAVKMTWTEQEVDPSTSRIKTVEKNETVTADPTADTLRKLAEAYIRDNGLDIPKVSLKVEFVDLWRSADYENIAAIEKVHLCDMVRVEFIKLGVSATAKVTKTEWDVLNERYSSIEIGDPKATLNDVVRSAVSRTASSVSGATTAADIATRVDDIEKEQSRQKAGNKLLTLSNATEGTLLTMSEIDEAFGLQSGTANNTNTIVSAVNADAKITTPIIGTAYNSNAWYVRFLDAIDGSVLVNYIVQYLGG